MSIARARPTLPIEVMRLICERHEAGVGTWRIAKELNERGVPTPQGGLKWRQSSVSAVLDSITGEHLLAKMRADARHDAAA